MTGTEGLRRDMVVLDLGEPISMPVGNDIRGRLFNVVGYAIDGIENPQQLTDYLFIEMHQSLRTSRH